MSARRRWVVGGVLVALPVAAWLAWWGWAQLRWRAALRAWEAERGPLEDVLLRFADAGPNQTALELERAAAALGIGLAPKGSPRGPQESTWPREVRDGIRSHVAAEVRCRTPGVTPPPPEVEAFLDLNAEAIDQVVHVLEMDEPPRWEMLTSLGAWAPLPNLGGQISLHRLLVAAGMVDLLRGRVERACELEAAAAKLAGALQGHSSDWALRFGNAMQRDRQPLLRALPVATTRWRVDPRSARPAMRDALEVEAWVFSSYFNDPVAIARQGAEGIMGYGPLRQPWSPPLVMARAPHLRAEAAATLDAIRELLALAKRAAPCLAAPVTPPVQLGAGMLELSSWTWEESLASAAAADFDAELTRVILDARRDRRPRLVPGSCPGWAFRVDVLPGDVMSVTALGRLPFHDEPNRTISWVEAPR